MHSSIYAMELRNLLDSNELFHLPVATPLLAGGNRHEPKSYVMVYNMSFRRATIRIVTAPR
jgi:hypothetical protein